MRPKRRTESTEPGGQPIDRIVEISADAAAGAVNGLQALSARRRAFSLRGSIATAVGNGTNALIHRLTPPTTPPSGPPGLGLLQLFLTSGLPATSTFGRAFLTGGFRFAPVVWRISNDKRARSAAALLTRIVFGHKRRPKG